MNSLDQICRLEGIDYMENEKFNLLFTLLRLKSYLISLIDDPDNCGDTFQFTEEYLSRIYPEKSTEIIFTSSIIDSS